MGLFSKLAKALHPKRNQCEADAKEKEARLKAEEDICFALAVKKIIEIRTTGHATRTVQWYDEHTGTTFSMFRAVHLIRWGLGGLLSCSDADFYTKANELRSHLLWIFPIIYNSEMYRIELGSDFGDLFKTSELSN